MIADCSIKNVQTLGSNLSENLLTGTATSVARADVLLARTTLRSKSCTRLRTQTPLCLEGLAGALLETLVTRVSKLGRLDVAILDGENSSSLDSKESVKEDFISSISVLSPSERSIL